MAGTINLAVGKMVQLQSKVNGTGSGPVGNLASQLTWTSSNLAAAAFVVGGASVTSAAGPTAFLQGLATGSAVITLTLGAFTDTLTVDVVANDEVNVASVQIVAPSS